ncbi:MAG: NfeD family protein [Pseudomonadota bacterium]
MDVIFSYEAVWLAVGIAALIAEVVTGGFWIGFFGFGALLTSLLLWLGVLGGLNVQLFFFALSSSIMVALLRKKIVGLMGSGTAGKAMVEPVGQIVHVVQYIPKQGSGQVEFQGSPWTAFSEENVAVSAGARARIVRHEGLKFWVTEVKE